MADEYDVFLSYSSADKPAVEAIALRLRDEAGLRPFLDAWHLVPGDPWMTALERAIERSAAVAVFLGPKGMGPWHEQESQLALVTGAQRRGKRVIPVLLPGTRKEDVDGFLSLRTWVELAEGNGFARLVAGVTGRAPGPAAAGGTKRDSTRGAPVDVLEEEVGDVSDARLAEELEKVIWDPERARNVALDAGFGPGTIPVMKLARVFWSRIIEDARNGAIRGRVQAVAEAAAREFPDNAIFRRYRGT